jgi:hypothetical protein
MSMRLNCWIVAMWLWLASHGKQYAWLRRSRAFNGLIPHFGFSERLGIRHFRSIEYRPAKGPASFVLAFRGSWVVTHYKLVKVRRHPTKEMAMNDFWSGK